MQREIPQPSQFYRHFKNKLYQIVAIAAHSETGEQLVIYQALYGDFKVYAKPLDSFLSPVDTTKYPDAKQTWQFQRVSFAKKTEPVAPTAPTTKTMPAPITFDTINSNPPARKENNLTTQTKKENSVSYIDKVEQVVTAFIEAESYENKLHILEENRDRCDSHMLESMAYLIDHSIDGRTVEEKYEDLHHILTTLIHFESSRLR